MINAAIVGLGWWGKTLVESAENSDAIRFVAGATRTEIVVTFLAVLELIRLKQIGVAQESPFSPIELVKLAVETREYLPDEPL